MEVTARLEGFEAVRAKLKEVAEAVSEKAVQSGIDAAADIVVTAAVSRCPVDRNPHLEERELLKKSLGKKVKKYRRSKTVVAIVGPRTGFRRKVGTRKRDGKKSKKGDPIYQDPANIGHLVEFGHAGPHPAPAHPFLRPAFDTTKDQQLSAAQTAIQEQLK